MIHASGQVEVMMAGSSQISGCAKLLIENKQKI